MLWRNGKAETVKLTLGELPGADNASPTSRQAQQEEAHTTQR